MQISVFDSSILRDFWCTQEMREVFSYENRIRKWLDYEAALAREQAKLGIIPQAAADEIARKADVKFLDMEFIIDQTKKTKHLLVPTIRALERACEGGYGEFVHFGATTQDVLDSGMMMQIKDAMAFVKRDLKQIGRALYKLSAEHRNTAMMGRTMALQALPITFGHKTAIWLSELERHFDRINDMEKRLYVGSVVGAVGTKASLTDKADMLERAVNERLGLDTPNISWQPSRDRLYEFASVIGGINASFNKIAHEILILAHNEFDEVAEPFGEDQIGSSTMPHKRNPVVSEETVTVSNVLKSSVAMLNDLTRHEHERDCSVWKAEAKVIPEICLMISIVLKNMKFVLSGLEVKKDKMLRNLNILNGYVLTERVMFALADTLGKQRAHEIVHQIAMKGIEENLPFKQMLMQDETAGKILTSAQIDELLDATTYVGYAPQLVDKLLADIDSRDFLK